ncbi:MAG TPA: hypothetical protein VII01_03935 [Solirubrobacteraceae bacterium]
MSKADANLRDRRSSMVADGFNRIADLERRWETSLDAAWAEAEAALPEGWMGPSVAQNWKGRWYAYGYRHHEDAPANPGIVESANAEDHDTPAAALRALAAKLREVGR